MLRGIYIATGGMSARAQSIDILANNLANVDTTAFKADKLASRAFGRMLLSRINDAPPGVPGKVQTPPTIGSALMGAGTIDSKYIDFTPGNIVVTENPLDLALDGPGFFQVSDQAGNIVYTRDGTFTIDDQKYLVNQSGMRVLDQAGKQIPILNPGDIKIDAQGQISIGGFPASTIGVVEFPDLSVVDKIGDNLFSAPTSLAINPAVNTKIVQGAIERSNVNPIGALTQLIARFREFETAARSLDMINSTLDKTVNQIGVVNI